MSYVSFPALATEIHFDADLRSVYRRLAKRWCQYCSDKTCDGKCAEACRARWENIDQPD